MTESAVQAEALTKIYRVYTRPLDRLAELLLRRPRHRPFHALDDVSFTVSAGEGFGLVGENGAGKSTLLKILAGITTPTSGRVEVRGKVASILELGSGFHPELTGRQNIVLNAAMLGLNPTEVRARTPAILDFCELGDFIDQPVKCYSTGMTMRLGFSIATQVDPDVLIIDEALSVGDGYFQKKCMDRLLELVAAGKTLLFCSHAMYYLSAFCQRAVWLRHGRVMALGPTAEVVREYEHFLQTRSAGSAQVAVPELPAPGPARLREVHVELPEPAGRSLRPGETLQIQIDWETGDAALAFHVGLGFNRADGVEVCSFSTQRDGLDAQRGHRQYSVTLEVPDLPLVKGRFTLYVFLLDESGLHIYDQRIVPDAFTVESTTYSFGIVDLPHRWAATRPVARPLMAAGAAR